MSGSPATSESMPLVMAASRLMALSKASGPSSRPLVICPRRDMVHSAAASMVDGILSVTVSTADRIATLGRSTPSTRTRSMALRQISAFSLSVGKMLTAASVMNSGLW
ncbi:hypothetical protein D3C72_1962260 [compost metagenome]